MKDRIMTNIPDHDEAKVASDAVALTDVDATAAQMLATGWWWDGTRMPPHHTKNIEAMARLWLLRGEIREVIDSLWMVVGDERASSIDTESIAATELLAKINSLGE